MTRHLFKVLWVCSAIVLGSLGLWVWRGEPPESVVAGVEASEPDYFGAFRQKLVHFETMFLIASHSGWSEGPLTWDGRIRGELDSREFMIYVDRKRRITADATHTPPGRYLWDGNKLLGFDSGQQRVGPIPGATAILKPFLEDAWAGFPGMSVQPANPNDYGYVKDPSPLHGAWYRLVTDAKWANGADVLVGFSRRTGDLKAILISGPDIPVYDALGTFRIAVHELAFDVPIPAWDPSGGLNGEDDWFVPGPPKRLCLPDGYSRATDRCLPPHHSEPAVRRMPAGE